MYAGSTTVVLSYNHTPRLGVFEVHFERYLKWEIANLLSTLLNSFGEEKKTSWAMTFSPDSHQRLRTISSIFTWLFLPRTYIVHILYHMHDVYIYTELYENSALIDWSVFLMVYTSFVFIRRIIFRRPHQFHPNDLSFIGCTVQYFWLAVLWKKNTTTTANGGNEMVEHLNLIIVRCRYRK